MSAAIDTARPKLSGSAKVSPQQSGLEHVFGRLETVVGVVLRPAGGGRLELQLSRCVRPGPPSPENLARPPAAGSGVVTPPGPRRAPGRCGGPGARRALQRPRATLREWALLPLIARSARPGC